MKKQKIQLIVLILILAALVGAFFGIRKYREAQAQKPVEEEGTVVFGLNGDDVVNLIYDYDGATYQYEKVEGTWYLAEDHTQTVDQYYPNAMATDIASLKADRVLENVTDLSQYGLESPQKSIIFDTAVQRFRIYVGDRNSLTASYYIQLPDQPDMVYIVPETCINRFNYGPADIIEPQEEETEAGADAGADTDVDAGTETDTGAGAESDTGAGAESDTGAGAESDTGTESDTGAEAGIEAGTGSDTGTESGAESDTGTEADTGSEAEGRTGIE